jgi:flagellar basal-body rod modification protein FlgD
MSYIDATTYNNASYAATTESASSELGQADFLTLLLAQMQNQDPLNPVEDAEMIAELAQFSSLEELQTMNESMTSAISALSMLTVNSAVPYIGKEIVAAGYSISKSDSGCTDVYFTPATDCESIKAHIYNEDGDVVATVDLGSAEGGEETTFMWNGLKTNGSKAANGTYTVGFEAYDADGESVYVASEVSGTVTGISSSNGTTVLELGDGRTVELMYVSKIVGSSGSSDSGSGSSDSEDSETLQ